MLQTKNIQEGINSQKVRLPSFFKKIQSTPYITESYGKMINNIDVAIAFGDMTELTNVDAWIVPQFMDCASYGGVGAAVVRAGGESGIQEYEKLLKKNGDQEFGAAHLTTAGQAKVKHLIHLVTVNSSVDKEFYVVSKAVLNGLKLAKKKRLTSIVLPALGTGTIGYLTAKQSAVAILNQIKVFSKEKSSLTKIAIVIYGDHRSYKDFVSYLENIDENSMPAQTSMIGEREFDIARFVLEFQRDVEQFENRKKDKEDNL